MQQLKEGDSNNSKDVYELVKLSRVVPIQVIESTTMVFIPNAFKTTLDLPMPENKVWLDNVCLMIMQMGKPNYSIWNSIMSVPSCGLTECFAISLAFIHVLILSGNCDWTEFWASSSAS